MINYIGKFAPEGEDKKRFAEENISRFFYDMSLEQATNEAVNAGI